MGNKTFTKIRVERRKSRIPLSGFVTIWDQVHYHHLFENCTRVHVLLRRVCHPQRGGVPSGQQHVIASDTKGTHFRRGDTNFSQKISLQQRSEEKRSRVDPDGRNSKSRWVLPFVAPSRCRHLFEYRCPLLQYRLDSTPNSFWNASACSSVEKPHFPKRRQRESLLFGSVNTHTRRLPTRSICDFPNVEQCGRAFVHIKLISQRSSNRWSTSRPKTEICQSRRVTQTVPPILNPERSVHRPNSERWWSNWW